MAKIGYFGPQGRQVRDLEDNVEKGLARARNSLGRLRSNGIPVEANATRSAIAGDHISVDDDGSVELPDHMEALGQEIVISASKSSNSGSFAVKRSNTGLIDGEDVDSISISGTGKRVVLVADPSGWRRKS